MFTYSSATPLRSDCSGIAGTQEAVEAHRIPGVVAQHEGFKALDGPACVDEGVAVPFIGVGQNHAVVSDEGGTEERAAVLGTGGKDRIEQRVRFSQAGLRLRGIAQVKLRVDALDTRHAPIAVADFLRQIQVLPRLPGEALEVFERSRDQAAPGLGRPGQDADCAIEIDDLVGELAQLRESPFRDHALPVRNATGRSRDSRSLIPWRPTGTQ